MVVIPKYGINESLSKFLCNLSHYLQLLLEVIQGLHRRHCNFADHLKIKNVNIIPLDQISEQNNDGLSTEMVIIMIFIMPK